MDMHFILDPGSSLERFWISIKTHMHMMQLCGPEVSRKRKKGN